MKHLITIAMLLTFCSAHAAQKDPNVTEYESKLIVLGPACLAYGGKFVNEKRYTMCDGGRYNGYVTNKLGCVGLALETESLVGADGMVDDETNFLKVTATTLKVCVGQAKNWPNLAAALSFSKKACDESANQGMSQLYRGQCYLKTANFAVMLLGMDEAP